MIAEVPRPLGGDRLEKGPGTGLWMESAAPKEGWVPRSPATVGSVEHPGASILWEEARWEVLEAQELPGGRVRYLLAPWDERHAIRVSYAYDERSEEERARSRADDTRRRRTRLLLLATAPVSGLAPTPILEAWEREYSVPAARLAVLSSIVPFVFGFLSVFSLIAESFGGLYAGVSTAYGGGGGGPLVPGGYLVRLFGIYLFVEALVRFGIAWSSGRACGSLLGTVPYLVWCAATGRTPLRPAPSYDPATARAVADRDAFLVREPLFGFLSVEDQRAAAERFGFDPVRWGRIGAAGTLALTAAQSAASFSRLAGGDGAAVLPLLLALGLAAEQVARLRRLAGGQPAPSVLRRLFRPLCRKLLGAPRPSSPR